MTIQPQNNNLNYLIYPAFTKVNRLFCRLQELLQETIEILFTLFCTECQNNILIE